MKGRALQLGEKVTLAASEAGELARAEVTDGSSRHTVTLRQEGRHALAECDCDRFEQGAFCRHIWATVLHLAQANGHSTVDVASLSKLRLRPPKARKRDHTSRPARTEEPSWVGRLTLLRHSAVDRATSGGGGASGGLPGAVLPVQRQVLFVVLPVLSHRHNGLVVELRQRNAIASGWSKPKQLRLSSDTLETLTDPADREIASLLLGAEWVSEHETAASYGIARSHATFRVPRGATRRLLRQMIDTGRCYLDPSDDGTGRLTHLRWQEAPGSTPGSAPGSAPRTVESGAWNVEREAEAQARPGHACASALPPDTPYRLYLVGTEVEDALRVDLELRRGESRLPINKPELILGGLDGLVISEGRVTPFDDRDAYRWVSQFRDERYEEDGSCAMHIKGQDIARFLDRLYMLPQLPELDLPPRWSRTEQRIEPTPHLELFSPGSSAQIDLAPSAAKQHLVARVWFDYAGTRINPAQPGRFVPVTPTEQDAAAGGGSLTAAPPDQETTVDGVLPNEPHSNRRLIRRHRRLEREAVGTLGSLGFRQTTSDTGDAMVLSARQAPLAIAALLARGWVVSADRQAVRSAGPPSLSISSGIDWFELHGGVTYQRADGSEQQVSLPEILRAVRSGQSMIVLDDGSQGLLPHDWLAEHGLLTALGEIEGDHLRFRSTQAAVLDSMLDDRELAQVDERFAQIRQRLRQFDGIKPIEPQQAFHGSLRPYQKEGLGWLAFLRWFGTGGILADDMGLGKTIQVLAMLQARKRQWDLSPTASEPQESSESQEPHAPSLIVVPRSLIFNWSDEAEKFTPELRVLAYTGPERTAHQTAFDQYDIIVTSYGLLRRDVEFLSDKKFDYVVLDEAQAIKNPQSQSAKAARLLRARHRLALTGTPIENHLGDLWSIFEFLNPGMLGANTRFGDLVRSTSAAVNNGNHPAQRATTNDVVPPPPSPEFDAEMEDDEQDQETTSAIEQVAAALRPFILRRTKHQVLKELPEKTEQTIICEMDGAQRQVYDELRRYYRGTLLNQLDQSTTAPGNVPGSVPGNGSGMGRNAFMVLEALLRLRQAACHPALIDKSHLPGVNLPGSGADLPSAKLDTLDEQLAEIIEEGSKALVFSQFTSMLALTKQRLDARGIKYAYLDGQTRDRKEQVERFQTDPNLSVFLISLKAGGTGLNLTAAEYVFILDPWWNPAVEAQAIDRTHRIGQTKPVFAYRLICEDTVEQRILELQKKKRKLAEAVVGEEQDLLSSLTRDDLEALLS